MKRLLLFIAACGLAFSQVRITDSLVSPINGRLFTGQLRIDAVTLMTCGGQAYMRDQAFFGIKRGALDITLMANDACTPSGTQYTVHAIPAVGPPWTEYWVVPSTVNVLGVADIRTSATVTPPVGTQIQPSQISTSGAVSGQCLAYNGTSWAPASCGTGGGGTWGSITGSLTSQADLYAALSAVTNPCSGGGSSFGFMASTAPTSTTVNGTTFDALLYLDAADGHLKIRAAAGTVTDLMP